MKIAVLGTGMVGNAIATKLVQVGHEIIVGSRSANSDAGQGARWERPISTSTSCAESDIEESLCGGGRESEQGTATILQARHL